MNRRELLHGVGTKVLALSAAIGGTAVAATSCRPTEAPAAVHDPLLEEIKSYREQSAFYNSSATDRWSDEQLNALRDRSWGPFYEAEALPAATTEQGAIEALRLVIKENAFVDGFTERLARAALAFFDGRANHGRS